MKRAKLVVLLSILFPLLVFGQAWGKEPKPAPTPPTIEDILERYVRAVGGRAAVEKITSRVMKGSLITAAGTARTEIYQKAPGKFLVIIDSPAGGVSKNAFDGAVAWSQNRQRGLREMSGAEVENFKREYDVQRELKLKQLYPKMGIKGLEKVGERDAYVLTAVAADGVEETMYFDGEDGLLLRRDVTLLGTTIQTYFQDYREVGGVKVPFTIKRQRGDFSFTYNFEQIEHNVAIDDTKFTKPVAN